MAISNSARRIMAIAELVNAKTYLEIGVDQGVTFTGVSIPNKVGVDPCFRFDFKAHETPTSRFHQVPSDTYFSTIATGQDSFDIIFLDGLHVFEQTFRDFCATQAHSHRNTVWLIDDVMPSDVFSSLRLPQDTLAFRRAAGGESLAWHGDVYKVPLAIADFFPSFDMRTIGTNGNGQTIVVRRPREKFTPASDSLEYISRLDYFGYSKVKDRLLIQSEEEVLAWLRQRLAVG